MSIFVVVNFTITPDPRNSFRYDNEYCTRVFAEMI